jgi:hypothetical protein
LPTMAVLLRIASCNPPFYPTEISFALSNKNKPGSSARQPMVST